MDSHVRSAPPSSAAARDRDAALARAGRVRGLTIAGSAALSAALAGLVAASPPSQASTSASAPRGTAARVTPPARPVVLRAPQLPPLESASALGLKAPSQPPQSGSSDQSSGGGSQGRRERPDGEYGCGKYRRREHRRERGPERSAGADARPQPDRDSGGTAGPGRALGGRGVGRLLTRLRTGRG